MASHAAGIGTLFYQWSLSAEPDYADSAAVAPTCAICAKDIGQGDVDMGDIPSYGLTKALELEGAEGGR